MRVLVIYAHPVPGSFNAAIHETVLACLRRNGHEIRDTDLYAEDFHPALTREEREVYHSPGENLTPAIARYVDDLQWAEALVFCFPTWWFGMPAIVKGYLDRVWVPGVAFHMPGPEGGGLKPGLRNIRKLALVTTYGAPWWLVHWVGGAARNVILRGLTGLMAPGLKTLYLAHHRMDFSTPESRAKFLAKVERKFGGF